MSRIFVKIAFLTLAMLVSGTALAAKILVVRKQGPDFAEVQRGLADEIGTTHRIVDWTIAKDTSYEAFATRVAAEKPDLLVVMDNQTVDYAVKLSRDPKRTGGKPIRAVATMALNLKSVLKGAAGVSGIAYEVPGYSIVTKFKRRANLPLKSVLVIYRASQFAAYVAEARTQLGREGVRLVTVDADAHTGSDAALAAFLEKQLDDDALSERKIDAVLVLSDNGLLTGGTFASAWVKSARAASVPFLCGLERFASRELDFCAFAAYPDHRELGNAVAGQVFSILDEGLSPAEIGVENLVTVSETVNAPRMKSLKLPLRP